MMGVQIEEVVSLGSNKIIRRTWAAAGNPDRLRKCIEELIMRYLGITCKFERRIQPLWYHNR